MIYIITLRLCVWTKSTQEPTEQSAGTHRSVENLAAVRFLLADRCERPFWRLAVLLVIGLTVIHTNARTRTACYTHTII